MIYSDGACLGNPGPGGYGVVLLYKGHRRELSGGFRRTTNNRMELLAVIEGLRALKGRCGVVVHSDSVYVVKAMTQRWPQTWRAKGWRLASKKPASNVDLWIALLALTEEHDVAFKWVPGHAGVRENERADVLATTAAREDATRIDEGYEQAPGVAEV